MRAWSLAILLVLGLGLGRPLQSGEVGSTLFKYSSAGAGVGALLGSAAATIPYLQSKQPYDFLTGAGIGLLGGSVAGFILGWIDVANPVPDASEAFQQRGLVLAWTPLESKLTWTTSF